MSDGSERAVRRLNVGMGLAALTALASLLLEHGFQVGPAVAGVLRVVDICCVVVFACLQLAKLLVVARPAEYFREHLVDFSLLFVLAVATIVHVGLQDLPEYRYLKARGLPDPLWAFYIATLQAYLLLIVVLRSPLVIRLLVWLHLRPAQLLCVAFLILTAGGTLLLMLPGASRAGARLPLVDALFTSTSAVCVTGLVVRDTGTQFTPLGLAILLGLFQIGGLGILTVTTSFALFSGRQLDREEETVLAQSLEVETADTMRHAVGRIVLTALVVEAVGAFLLFRLWSPLFEDSFQRGVWSVFHAVSAFCNAGFALFPDNASLTAFVGDGGTVLVIGGLIILGGLGCGVVAELGRLVVAAGRRQPRRTAYGVPQHTADGARQRPRLTRHARWVLWASGVLVVLGVLCLWLLESRQSLSGLSAGQRWLAAVFQSVTLRTAGFNTVDLSAFGTPAVLVCIVWMLIGGSPGGTAGGMKTTTAAVGLAALCGRLRAEPGLRRRAARLGLIFLGAYVLSCVLVGLVQGEWNRRIAFEVASALGTVGLSLGYTVELSTAGKLAIALVMFAGRVGPFALAASLLRWRDTEAERDETPPEQRILLG